jgi:anti-sigma B factor antagonist
MTTTAGGTRSMLVIRKETVPPDVTVLHLSGRVAMGRPCQEIESHVEELIREKTPKLVLDLSDVQRVDSTGFGVIVTSAGKLKKAGGSLHVAGAKGIVQEIAHTSNISKVVPFYPSVEEAIDALQS